MRKNEKDQAKITLYKTGLVIEQVKIFLQECYSQFEIDKIILYASYKK